MWGYRWRSIWKTGSEAIKKTGEKVEKIYKAASIKTINFCQADSESEDKHTVCDEKRKLKVLNAGVVR